MTLALMLSVSSVLFAATDTNKADSAGAEQARFDQEQEFRQRVLRMRTLEKEAPAIEVPAKEGESIKEGMTFKLNGVTLSGNYSIPVETFTPTFQKYIGKEVHLADLREIASEVKRHYRDQGYIAAYVYIPPQTIAGGVVEIAVIEGKLGLIEVTGNKWFSASIIRKFLRFSAGQVLFYDNLRNALSFINKYRDIKVSAILKPGKAPKTTDLELKVKDSFPFHLGADVNNLGTQNTGKTRVGFSLSDTNLFGQMDQLTSRYQLGSHTWSIGADYNIPVNSYGTRVGISYTRSSVQLAGPYQYLGIRGHATDYGIYVLQPFIRRSWVETALNLGFDWKSVINMQDANKAGVDELRILNAGLNTEFTDKWGKTFFPQSFYVGFSGFLGASHKLDHGATRPGTGGQFTIYRSSLIRYQRLPKDMMYVFRGQLQLTNNPLPPSEQLALGGAFAVRGYSQGEYLADYGGFITNELYVPTYFFPKDWKLPRSTEPLRNQIQGVTFFDFGGGVLRKPLVGEKTYRTLAGAGLGVRIHMFDKVYGRIQWAMPTGSRPETTGSRTAFYYGVSAEFM